MNDKTDWRLFGKTFSDYKLADKTNILRKIDLDDQKFNVIDKKLTKTKVVIMFGIIFKGILNRLNSAIETNTFSASNILLTGSIRI